jgi:hypothetical protein
VSELLRALWALSPATDPPLPDVLLCGARRELSMALRGRHPDAFRCAPGSVSLTCSQCFVALAAWEGGLSSRRHERQLQSFGPTSAQRIVRLPCTSLVDLRTNACNDSVSGTGTDSWSERAGRRGPRSSRGASTRATALTYATESQAVVQARGRREARVVPRRGAARRHCQRRAPC